MKKLIVIFFVLIFFTGCKKAIENIAQDLVVQAMVDGQWGVTKFTLNNTNITADFSGYKFKYYTNKTVDAILNGTKERTGSWNGSATDLTTWADFPGAPSPISLINGTWNITKSGWTYVEATQTNGAEVKTLRLDKF